MNLPDTTQLSLSLEDGVLHATLDRPKAGNALSATLVAELAAVFAAIRDDRQVRVVVMRGAGKHFCSGGDLKSMVDDTGAPNRAGVIEYNQQFGALLQAIDSAPQAVVVSAGGAAMGGGLGLLCVADVTILDRESRLGMPEARLGLPAAQIWPFVAARIGVAQARRLAVCGLRFDAQHALQLGVGHYLEDNAEAREARVTQTLNDILACAPNAVAAIKSLAAQTGNDGLEERLAQGAAVFADCLLSDEGHEGTRAFVEKRAPQWQVSKA